MSLKKKPVIFSSLLASSFSKVQLGDLEPCCDEVDRASQIE